MRPLLEPSCEFTYEAAHWLPMVPDGHKCRRVHGHSYRLKVTVTGPIGDDGFVVDFADIKSAVDPIIAQLDHQMLNDVGLPNPTVENQLIWLWEQIKTAGVRGLSQLALHETGTCSAVYRGEESAHA